MLLLSMGFTCGTFCSNDGDIHERKQNDCAGNLRWIKFANQFFDGDDRNIFRSVRAGDKREDRSGLRAIHHHDGNVCSGVHTRRHFDIAVRFLPGRGRSRADAKAGLRVE